METRVVNKKGSSPDFGDANRELAIDIALKTPVAEGGPSHRDGGTAGTGSWGGRGAKGDVYRQAHFERVPDIGM